MDENLKSNLHLISYNCTVGTNFSYPILGWSFFHTIQSNIIAYFIRIRQ
jgi:hypothetical protein